MTDPARIARWQVFAAGLLFSTGGVAIKACAFTTWQVAGLRSAIAAVLIVALAPGSRRGWTWRTGLVATSYAATLILYIAANKLTTAANAIFLQSAAPLYLLVLSPLLLREPPSRRDLGLALLIGLGITIIFAGDDAPLATATDPRLGNVLGALSGVAWAFTILGMRSLGRTGGSASAAAAVVAGNVLTAAVALPMALPIGAMATSDWFWIVYLGTAQVGLAYVLVTRASPLLPAVTISLILMIEPAVNPLLTWLVHRETPSIASLVGGALIVSALAAQVLRSNSRRPVTPPGIQTRGTTRR